MYHTSIYTFALAPVVCVSNSVCCFRCVINHVTLWMACRFLWWMCRGRGAGGKWPGSGVVYDQPLAGCRIIFLTTPCSTITIRLAKVEKCPYYQDMTTLPAIERFNYNHISAATLLADPDRLRAASQVYFSQTLPQGPAQLSANHPTPEGLAQALGWASFARMRSDVQKLLQKNANDPNAPCAVTDTILAACAMMQDYYLKHGLNSSINTTISKFIASAYFDTYEKQHTTTESRHTEDRTITIRVQPSTPTSPDEAKEIARLEKSLRDQTAAELASLGRATTREQPGASTLQLEDII